MPKRDAFGRVIKEDAVTAGLVLGQILALGLALVVSWLVVGIAFAAVATVITLIVYVIALVAVPNAASVGMPRRRLMTAIMLVLFLANIGVAAYLHVTLEDLDATCYAFDWVDGTIDGRCDGYLDRHDHFGL